MNLCKELILKEENGRKKCTLWFNVAGEIIEVEIFSEFENYEGLWEIEESIVLNKTQLFNFYKFISNYI